VVSGGSSDCDLARMGELIPRRARENTLVPLSRRRRCVYYLAFVVPVVVRAAAPGGAQTWRPCLKKDVCTKSYPHLCGALVKLSVQGKKACMQALRGARIGKANASAA